MKTLTIGRGEGCDIFIDDYRISRRHALLKIHTLGKMEIVDMGKNGTWVNGVKLRSGVPFPVKRKDVVNFANATQLNWNQVSNPAKYCRIGAMIAALIIVAILAISLIMNSLSDPSSEYGESTIDNANNTEQQTGGNLITDSATVSGQSGNNQEKTDKKDNQRDAGKPTLKDLFPEKPKVKKEEPKTQDKGKATNASKGKNPTKGKQQNKSQNKKDNKSYEIL